MSKLSRRETLARGGQAVVAAAVLPVAAKAALASEGEDSELVTLWRLHQERFERVERLQDVEDRLFPHRARDQAQDRIKQEWRAINEIEHQIATIPANTFAGLAIKLRIGTDNQPFRLYSDLKEGDLSADEFNLMNALADAERLAGRAP